MAMNPSGPQPLFPNYTQLRTLLPVWAWTLLRYAALAAAVAVCALLLARPALGLMVFWGIAVPSLPLVFMLAPGLWRNVCPLATSNQLPVRLGLSLAITRRSLSLGLAYPLGFGALIAFIIGRKLVFNASGSATALLIFGALVAALLGGALFKGKSGWCSSLCPLLPVQRLLGQNAFVQVANTQCQPCVSCTKNCYDYNPSLATLADEYDEDPRYARYRRIFAMLFPGLVLGFYRVPDLPPDLAHGLALFGPMSLDAVLAAAEIVGLMLAHLAASLLIFGALDRLVGRTHNQVPALAAALGLTTYYWFAAPLIATNLGKLALLAGLAPELASQTVDLVSATSAGTLGQTAGALLEGGAAASQPTVQQVLQPVHLLVHLLRLAVAGIALHWLWRTWRQERAFRRELGLDPQEPQPVAIDLSGLRRRGGRRGPPAGAGEDGFADSYRDRGWDEPDPFVDTEGDGRRPAPAGEAAPRQRRSGGDTMPQALLDRLPDDTMPQAILDEYLARGFAEQAQPDGLGQDGQVWSSSAFAGMAHSEFAPWGDPAPSAFGQSQFGQSQFGQSQFGQSQFGQSQFGASQFGTRELGGEAEGGRRSEFGRSEFGRSEFGRSGMAPLDADAAPATRPPRPQRPPANKPALVIMPTGKPAPIRVGQTLLEALEGCGTAIHPGCRAGSCGADAVAIHDGGACLGSIGSDERATLERLGHDPAQVRLACVARLRKPGPVTLEVLPNTRIAPPRNTARASAAQRAAVPADWDPTIRRVIIIGNGVAGLTAAETIRSLHPECEIHLISRERQPSYQRIALAKLFAMRSDASKLALKSDDWYLEQRLHCWLNTRVAAIDTRQRQVTLATQEVLPYDRLIMATGAVAWAPDIDGFGMLGSFVLRQASDALALRNYVHRYSARRAYVLGAGLLGIEAADALAQNGMAVTLLTPNEALLERQVDAEAGEIVAAQLRRRGVRVLTGTSVAAVPATALGRVSRLVLADGQVVEADLLLCCTGTRPDIALARSAGLATERGILVDRRMRTSASDVFACGDVAQSHQVPMWGLWAPAAEQGRVAALSALGKEGAWEPREPVTVLKLPGLSVRSTGRTEARGPAQMVFTHRVLAASPAPGHEPQGERYTKLITERDTDGAERLVGAIVVGDDPEGDDILEAAVQRRFTHELAAVFSGRPWQRQRGQWPDAEAPRTTALPAPTAPAGTVARTPVAMPPSVVPPAAAQVARAAAPSTAAAAIAASVRPATVAQPAVTVPASVTGGVSPASPAAGVPAQPAWADARRTPTTATASIAPGAPSPGAATANATAARSSMTSPTGSHASWPASPTARPVPAEPSTTIAGPATSGFATTRPGAGPGRAPAAPPGAPFAMPSQGAAAKGGTPAIASRQSASSAAGPAALPASGQASPRLPGAAAAAPAASNGPTGATAGAANAGAISPTAPGAPPYRPALAAFPGPAPGIPNRPGNHGAGIGAAISSAMGAAAASQGSAAGHGIPGTRGEPANGAGGPARSVAPGATQGVTSGPATGASAAFEPGPASVAPGAGAAAGTTPAPGARPQPAPAGAAPRSAPAGSAVAGSAVARPGHPAGHVLAPLPPGARRGAVTAVPRVDVPIGDVDAVFGDRPAMGQRVRPRRDRLPPPGADEDGS